MGITVTQAAKEEIARRNETNKAIRIFISGIG
jgi:Fe-S cluster assembly iron-binding protein IscA